jgi:hypothetical protein
MAEVNSISVTKQENIKFLKELAEYVVCAANPQYFLTKYALIKSTEGKFVPFNLYQYQKEALLNLVSHRLVIVLKNRQVGWTWLVAGYALWCGIFKKAANIIIISKDESAATEVLDYCRFIYNNLPDFLKPEMDRDRTALLAFPKLSSKIRALSATIASGIGFGSASLVILDENDFHPYAEDNYVEIKPMIDAGGNRQLIILSAPNRSKINSSFKSLWREARKGNNNFFPILTAFGCVPYHTEEWYEQMKREYITQHDLETRYFKTETEALSVTVAGKFFDPTKLLIMSDRVLKPLPKYEAMDLRGGIIRIYKPPVVGQRYCIYTDPSMGKEDPSHIVVGDLATKEEVANCHAWLPSDEVALIHHTLVTHYNNAYNSYEYNGYTGGRFQAAIDALNTPHQALARTVDRKEKKDKHGYWMSMPMKKQLLGQLRESIFNLEPIIHDAETIDELNLMIWEDGEDMPHVPDKEHDDRITAWCGLTDLFRRVPKGNYGGFTIL